MIYVDDLNCHGDAVSVVLCKRRLDDILSIFVFFLKQNYIDLGNSSNYQVKIQLDLLVNM